MIRGIRDMSVETPEEARVVLSTVHQMKGLESGAIRILDDVVNGVVDARQPPDCRTRRSVSFIRHCRARSATCTYQRT